MKKFLAIILALLLLVLMLPMTAAAEGGVYPVSSEAELRTALNGLTETDSQITVTLENDITISGGSLSVNQGTLTILGQGHTLCSSNHAILVINGSAVVNLGAADGSDTLILTSTDDTSGVVGVSGTSVLNMYHGVEIRDSRAGGQAGGVQLIGDKTVFNMYGGVIDNCVNWASVAGGVYIDGGALFNMYDGVIRNCSGCKGGAVTVSGAAPIFGGYISGSSGFHMYGGTIKDCNDKGYGGGAVCAYTAKPVSFIMDGGTITGCSGDGNGYGGAVFIFTTHPDAVIEINKGEITGNTGVYGGGVFVYEGTVKIADGVALHNNTATEEGDDLYNESGSVTLGKLPAGLKLAACGCDIDGWYHDKKDARWSSTKCGGEADQMEKYTETTITEGCALKAAHGEAPAAEPPLIIIVPEAPEQEAPNPTTGSRDLADVAAAMAAVSLLGAAAVIRKK